VRFPIDAFKIAAQLIEQQLGQPTQGPSAEPADLPARQPLQRSVLSLLESHGADDRATATEQSSRVLTHPRQEAWTGS